LYHVARSLGCYVGDTHALAYCTADKVNYKVLIYIHPDLSYKEKLGCLAHELGHRFELIDGKYKFLGRKSYGEPGANAFAVAYFKKLGIPQKEYDKLYRKAVRYMKGKWAASIH